MKNIFTLLYIALFSISLQAQDLIVTNEDDSLNCKITKLKSDHIYFVFKHKEEIRNTLLPLKQVKNYQYNFYPTAEVSADEIKVEEIYSRFRFAVNGGWSYRLAKLSDDIPSDFEKYTKDLKSGFHYGLDGSYYFSEQLGVGLKFNIYRSKNEIDNVYITYQDGGTEFGKMSDDISIYFIGPLFASRLMNADKTNSFYSLFGLGYLGYKNNATLISSKYTIKGSTVGLCWDVGYDIGLSEKVALGFQLSFVLGSLRELEKSDGTYTETIELDEDNYENLSRIDLSVGLRLNL